LLSLPLAASAIPIKVEFSVRGTDGPLVGVKRWGWFTYSDSSIPAGGTGLVGGSGAIEDLFLQWGGVTYTENEIKSGGMQFINGALTGATFGTVCRTELSCVVQPLPVGGLYFDVQSLLNGLFTYNLNGVQRYGETTIKRAAVPEPSTVLLFALALGGLGVGGFRFRRDH
jgi:hypothetical protein